MHKACEASKCINCNWSTIKYTLNNLNQDSHWVFVEHCSGLIEEKRVDTKEAHLTACFCPVKIVKFSEYLSTLDINFTWK